MQKTNEYKFRKRKHLNRVCDGTQPDGPVSGDPSVEQRNLPIRITRGKRFQTLVGKDALVDEEFWKLQTWEESTSDQEWVPGDEDISSTSSMNETSEDTSEDISLDVDQKEDRLLKMERYEEKKKIQKKRQLIYKDTMITGGSFNHQKKKKVKQSSLSKYLKKKSQPCHLSDVVRRDTISQEEHLCLADETEQINTQKIFERVELSNWKKALKESKKTKTRWTGSMELLIFWASNRLLHNEKETTETGAPYCKELLFFANFDHPEETKIPSIYTSRKENVALPCKPSTFRHKYRDPLTGKPFSTIESFLQLRETEDAQCQKFIEEAFCTVETKLKTLLSYMNENNLLEQFFKINEFSDIDDSFVFQKKLQTTCRMDTCSTQTTECERVPLNDIIQKNNLIVELKKTPLNTLRKMMTCGPLNETSDTNQSDGQLQPLPVCLNETSNKSKKRLTVKRSDTKKSKIRRVTDLEEQVTYPRQPLRIHSTPQQYLSSQSPDAICMQQATSVQQQYLSYISFLNQQYAMLKECQEYHPMQRAFFYPPNDTYHQMYLQSLLYMNSNGLHVPQTLHPSTSSYYASCISPYAMFVPGSLSYPFSETLNSPCNVLPTSTYSLPPSNAINFRSITTKESSTL